MRAGEMRRQVKLQQRTVSGADSFGNPTYSWTDVVTMWAAIESLTGRELFAAQAMNSEITHVITTRYQATFADPKAVAAMRVSYGTRLFNIHACLNVDERNIQIQMLCSEGLNNG